jgi:hypothetical protein
MTKMPLTPAVLPQQDVDVTAEKVKKAEKRKARRAAHQQQ